MATAPQMSCQQTKELCVFKGKGEPEMRLGALVAQPPPFPLEFQDSS